MFQKTLNDLEVYDGYIHIVFDIEDTKQLEAKTYFFDLEVTFKTTPICRKTKKGYFTLLDSITN